MITAQHLREILHYEPTTGAFTWLKSPRRDLVGKRAGYVNTKGYIVISIQGKNYYAHRLAWVYQTDEWPIDEVDHEDLIKSNNIWSNLRAATRKQNSTNMGLRSSNKSGYKGVCFNDNYNSWHANIVVDGEQINLGFFAKVEDAAAAYDVAAKIHHKQFARIN